MAPSTLKSPLRFQAQADSDNARLEISGTGTGDFHVGAVSLMPADNVQGFRAEVVATLKQLHFGVLRFPGGNFVSAHEWRNAVGDIDKRPPIWDPVWHAVQPNDVGTDEFVTLCRLLDVEPYITVNAGFGDAWSARELVEYANGAATTPMGRWRAANGHSQPYHVRFWGIGNEPWGDYQMGSMALDQFELKHNLFAKAMRGVDPSIKLIAGGAMPDVMAGANQSQRINGQIVPDYLSKADWSGNLLLHCLDNIDMLSEHYYSSSDMHLDLKTGKKVNIGPQSLVEWERAPATQVRVKYEHYQQYLKLIPGLRAKPVPIAIDEWAYFAGGAPNLQGGSGLRLGFPRDVSPFRPLSVGRIHVRDGDAESRPHQCGFEPNRPIVQDVSRALWLDSGRSVWRFAAAEADLSRRRRPARGQSGQRYLSSGCECRAH